MVTSSEEYPREPLNQQGDAVRVRTVDPVADHDSIVSLYLSGQLGGDIETDDLSPDLRGLEQAYLDTEAGGSHFWVAEVSPATGPEVVGMIGLLRASENAAEIRRLRVHPQYRQRGVGARLVEEALAFCRDYGYLKVILDTRIERAPAVALFERFGFQHNRSRDVNGKVVMDFYLDLYREQPPIARTVDRRTPTRRRPD